MTSTRPGTPPRARRSRITPEREAELYAAVLGLLREVGYDALTMEAVAARTRCSKATLYRRWTGKPHMVAEALRHQKPLVLAGIDTGSLLGDLNAAVTQWDDRQLAQDTALLRGLLHAVYASPDLRQALRDLLVTPELDGLDKLLTRAVEQGELAADLPSLAYVPYLLLGALIARPLIEDRPADSAFLHRYVNAVTLAPRSSWAAGS